MRGFVWHIPLGKFTELIAGNCHYCGIAPIERILKGKSLTYNGIDRVDSSIGYVDHNVVSCCEQCNRAKRDMTLEEFCEWIIRITNNLGIGK